MSCSAGFKISNNLFGIDLYLKEKYLFSFYEKNPVLARFIFVPLGAISGLAKVFLFPLISVVGLIVLPIFAGIRLFQGRKEDAKDLLAASGFCLLGAGGTIAILAITGFHIPLIWSCGLFVSFIVISMSIHIFKMAKEPPLTSRPHELI